MTRMHIKQPRLRLGFNYWTCWVVILKKPTHHINPHCPIMSNPPFKQMEGLYWIFTNNLKTTLNELKSLGMILHGRSKFKDYLCYFP